MAPNEVLQAALDYAARGWAVVPIRRGSKVPLTSHGVHDATRESGKIRAWFDRWPSANVAMALGSASRLAVLDTDSAEAEARLQELAASHGHLPDTLTSRTGRGRHRFFRVPIGTAIRTRTLAPGLELLGDGHLATLPPSVHESGKLYQWEVECGPAPLPPWLAALGKKPENKAGASGEGEPIPEGQRNSTLTSLAGSVRRRGMSVETIEQALLAENARRCSPPLPESEVRSIARSVGKYSPAAQASPGVNVKREPEHLTDVGNAKRLVARYGQDIRFCKSRGWLVWDGRRWAQDDGEIEQRGKQTAVSIYAAAAAETDPERRQKIAKWALQSESEGRIKAMIALAESEPEVRIKEDKLDADPWLLNVNNGIIDLRTGELSPHRPEHLITKLVPVEYDPDAGCPKFLVFLTEIMDGRAQLVEYLQRAFGYMLSGVTTEQVFHLFYGTGSNGKSTLLEIMRAALGDYALASDFTTFLERKYQGIPNDIARLAGARLVTAVEAEVGKKFAEVVIKQLTGGDKITARFLNKEFFEFYPQAKFFLAANHKPIIRGTDLAIWRRIALVPFTVTIPNQKQDKRLKEKLLAELPGILAWFVQGCLRWQRDGLMPPEEVVAATENYREQMDLLGEFLTERCVVNPKAAATAKELYCVYKQWCQEREEKPTDRRIFGTMLEEKGFQKGRIGKD